jgi:hypothetical protein
MMDWTMIFSGWAAAMGTASAGLTLRTLLRGERHSVKINALEKNVTELQVSSRKHSGNITQLMHGKKARA